MGLDGEMGLGGGGDGSDEGEGEGEEVDGGEWGEGEIEGGWKVCGCKGCEKWVGTLEVVC